MNKDDAVRYMDKSRDYYAAQGYEVAYKWSHYDTIPWIAPRAALSELTLTVVTTAMPDDGYVKRNRRLAIGDLQDPPAALFTGELAWDEDATHTNDRETYLPVNALNRAVAAGRIGRLAPHFYSVPTLYSARHTIEQDAPAIVAHCRRHNVDVALLVPL